jgi:DTW domain-containing protein
VRDFRQLQVWQKARSVCYQCFKPQIACICDGLVRVPNRTGLFVFQHPRERFHPLGTARFVRLGFERARVETLWPGALDVPAADLPEGTALLYPSEDARDVASLPPKERPMHLAVIDGTWHHARTLHRDTPWLQQLPHLRLTPRAPSRYRIRREPRPDYLSTLEAIVRALELLEPGTPHLDTLLGAFDRMIDRQIALGAGGRKVRRIRTRAPGTRGIPLAFLEQWDRIVVVYGESSLVEPAQSRREILQWTAVRPSTGETFEALIRPTQSLLRPWHLDHMQVTEAAIQGGVARDAFTAAWQAFAQRDDVLVAWNHGILDLLRGDLGHQGPHLVLKSVCHALDATGQGSIEDRIARLGLAAPPLALHGRASERLGNALALAWHLRRAASV